jgi:excisionase family DNA binding protein
MTETPTEFLTVPEVAELIGVHRATVRNWITLGHLPAFKAPGMRGHLRVRRADLDAFIDGSTRAHQPTP